MRSCDQCGSRDRVRDVEVELVHKPGQRSTVAGVGAVRARPRAGTAIDRSLRVGLAAAAPASASSRWKDCPYVDQAENVHISQLEVRGTTCYKGENVAFEGATAYYRKGIGLRSFRTWRDQLPAAASLDGQRWYANLELKNYAGDYYNQYVQAQSWHGGWTTGADVICILS